MRLSAIVLFIPKNKVLLSMKKSASLNSLYHINLIVFPEDINTINRKFNSIICRSRFVGSNTRISTSVFLYYRVNG